ncbi:MAG TPA: TRAP transporter small permease subunit [Sphingomonadales bacterium]|nr:TRAP transporter small permease subunit [Sphingomonadales bacterium]
MAFLLKLADRADAFNRALGRASGWAVFLLVLAEFSIVVLSGNFQEGSIKLQESVLYLNSLVFLGAAGYALLTDAHVRVDIFYRGLSERAQAKVNLVGTLAFLLPFLAFLWSIAVPFVAASWRNLEGSFETSGLPLVFVLKSFILLFALTLTVQGFSLAVRALATLRPGSS